MRVCELNSLKLSTKAEIITTAKRCAQYSGFKSYQAALYGVLKNRCGHANKLIIWIVQCDCSWMKIFKLNSIYINRQRSKLSKTRKNVNFA